MQTSLLLPIIIYFIIPLLGVGIFIWLMKKMSNEKVISRPVLSLFIIFATYGGLLLMVLTTYFWEWSGMASLGMAYLIFIAPLLMIIIAIFQYKLRTLSGYHLWTFRLSILYFVIATITLAILFYTSKS